jgi:predicted hydrocarbon binding protein
MIRIEKSGFCNTNTFAHVNLNAIEDIAGKNGIDIVLKLAGLEHLIDNYPPMNREKIFDFSDYSMINLAIREIYGDRGGRVMAIRAGRVTFKELLSSYGAMVGMTDLAMRLVPLKIKITLGLNAMAKVFNMVSDQLTTVEEKENGFLYSIARCPACWGLNREQSPICAMQIGLIQEGLSWLSGGKRFKVTEIECRGMGADRCTFLVEKEPLEE